MTINISLPENHDLKPRITVIGVGGAGGNAVNNMITSQLEGVDFVVANTDAQSLEQALTERHIQLGVTITHGLGSGARPDIGKAAAEEALDEIIDYLQGSHMVFIAAGMGGGTGTGGAPVIARAAREQGILTVGVVTKPFQFEGLTRMRIADTGIEELQQFVDTLIIIPNQNLFRVANEKTTFAEAFKMADNVLHQGVRGVTDLMVMPGLINLDFADVRTVMSEMGKAMMGTGESEGERRATESAEAAISNPLLDDVSMKGARGVLINITGGEDITLFEVDEAVNRIRDEVEPEANIIFGSTFDANLEGKMRVSVVATGIDALAKIEPELSFGAGPRLVAVTPSRASEAETESEPAESAEAVSESVGEVEKTVAPIAASAAVGMSFHASAALPGEPAAKAEARPASKLEESPAKLSPERSDPTLKPKEEAFIPPPPMKAPRPQEEVKAPEPFAAAAMANGTREAEKKGPQSKSSRAPSLFERMTRSGRARETKAEKPEAAPAQSALKDLEPASTPSEKTANQDEDFLDIPAFLRRQAT